MTNEAMPRVDFYILNQGEEHCYRYLAHLVEKAYHQQYKVFIFTATESQSQKIDNLLWSYRDTSFLPHHILDQNLLPAPISISHQYLPEQRDILINLSNEVPDFFAQFPRVVELIFANEEAKQIGRLKYRQYQKQQCEIQTFPDISS